MRNTNTNRSKKSTHSCIRNPSTNKREAIRNTCPRSHLSVPPSICLPPPPHPTIPWELLRKVRTLTIVFVSITYWRFVILFESVTKKQDHIYVYHNKARLTWNYTCCLSFHHKKEHKHPISFVGCLYLHCVASFFCSGKSRERYGDDPCLPFILNSWNISYYIYLKH